MNAPAKQRPASIRRVQRQLPKVVAKKSQARSRSSVIGITLGIITLTAIFIITPIMINTSLAMLSYEMHDYRKEMTQLKEENQRLQMLVNEQASPAHIRQEALRQGLVQAGETGYIHIGSGKLIEGKAGKPPTAEEIQAIQMQAQRGETGEAKQAPPQNKPKTQE